MWAVRMPSTTTSPQATSCLRALEVVKDHTAHVLDFTRAAAFKAIPDIPKGFYTASNVYCSQ